MQEVGSVQEWSSFPGERYGGIEGGMGMGAAPTVGPQAWVLAVGKGQGPIDSSPLTCEGQCSNSTPLLGSLTPAILLSSSAWPTVHSFLKPERPPSSLSQGLAFSGPCRLRLHLGEASSPSPCPWAPLSGAAARTIFTASAA